MSAHRIGQKSIGVRNTESENSATRQATDTEMLDWLARECYLPEDHPINDICVLIPESVAPLGAFTLNPENDKKVLRYAIQCQMNKERHPSHRV